MLYKNIEKQLHIRGWTLYKLSKEANVSESGLRNLKSGRIKTISIDTAAKLAEALEITIDQLYYDKLENENYLYDTKRDRTKFKDYLLFLISMSAFYGKQNICIPNAWLECYEIKDGILSFDTMIYEVHEFCDEYNLHYAIEKEKNSEEELIKIYFNKHQGKRLVEYAIQHFVKDKFEKGEKTYEIFS